MSSFVVILRWICAAPVALAAYMLTVAGTAVLLQKIGGDTTSSLMSGASAAILFGTLVAPRVPSWKAVAAGLAALTTLSFLAYAWWTAISLRASLTILAHTVAGCALGYAILSRIVAPLDRDFVVIVRWLGALLAAAAAYVLTSAFSVLVLRTFNDSAIGLSLTWAAIAAVLIGTLTAPRKTHWKISATIFAMLTMLFSFGLIGYAWLADIDPGRYVKGAMYVASGLSLAYLCLYMVYGRVVPDYAAATSAFTRVCDALRRLRLHPGHEAIDRGD